MEKTEFSTGQPNEPPTGKPKWRWYQAGSCSLFATMMSCVLFGNLPLRYISSLTTVHAADVALPADVTPAAQPTGDWKQWGGSSRRNNTPEGRNIPTEWNIGEFDEAGEWQRKDSKNIKWAARLGSVTHSTPVVANGKVFIGTNNALGRVKRYPADVDLSCLQCFDEATGKFLWQDSNEKLAMGRSQDWPDTGIVTTPLVEGKRLWYVTNRGHVRCLDVEGFRDGVNDGPFREEPNENLDEADVIWSVDMIKDWGVFPHNQCTCSLTSLGDVLLVCTSNGVNESHVKIPNPKAPSFVALDKTTGKLLWQDNSPGENILHGTWASPAADVIDGIPQAIFGGGDGWVYSFDVRGDNGKSKLLWRFDANPKASKYVLGGHATRNPIVCAPVIHDAKVYVCVGDDPEHGEGIGHLYCIDATKRGDISDELVVRRDDPTKTPLEHRRYRAVDESKGEIAIANPNSGMIWHYDHRDNNGDGQIQFEETMHRSLGSVAIKNGLLFVADFGGVLHCLDAKTGKVHWTHNLKTGFWGSPLIVEDRVYIGDENGTVTIFRLSDKKELIKAIEYHNSIFTTLIVANNVLYVTTKDYLFAIAAEPAKETAK